MRSPIKGVCVLGPEGEIRVADRSLTRMLGRDADALIGVPIADLSTASGAGARVREWLERLRSGGECSIDIELQSAKGPSVWTLVTARSVLGRSGRYEGAVAILTPIATRGSPGRERSVEIGRELHSVADKPALFAYVDSGERFRFVSERFEHYFDQSRDEIEGSTLREVLGADAYETVRRQVGIALTGERIVFETWMHFPRVGRRSMKWLFVPECGEDGRVKGLFCLASDVTDIREMEEAVGAERDLLKAILDTTGALIVVLDRQAKIVRFNRACERATGYRAQDVEGKPVWILLDPSEEDAVREVFGALATGKEVANAFENDWVARDGTTRRIAWSNTVLRDDDGNVEFVVATGLDITERRRAEQALVQRGEDLSALTARLLDAEELERRRIAAELHDDLNQSLALLSVDAETLARNAPSSPEAFRKEMMAMKERIDSLSDDVHNLARELHPSTLDDLGLAAALETLVEHYASRFRIRARFNDRNVPRDLPRDKAICLYRIAQEGLHNVVKHSGSGRVDVRLFGIGECTCLSVRDYGKGFDPEKVKTAGRGLGLLSMQERTARAGGVWTIRSAPGFGTRVRAGV